MIKLENWRCTECTKEQDVFRDTNDPNEEIPGCDKCSGTLERFNFKNNGQRYRFADQNDTEDYWGDGDDWD